MTIQQEHIIGKQFVEINFNGSKSGALEFNHAIGRILNGSVKGRLLQEMDRVVGAPERIHIDKLTLDLDCISVDQFETQFEEKLVHAFGKAIDKWRNGGFLSSASSELTASGQVHHAWDAYCCFLQTGQLPWWSAYQSMNDLEIEVSNYIRLYSDWKVHFIQLLKENAGNCQRFVFQTSDELIVRLTGNMTGLSEALIHSLHQEWAFLNVDISISKRLERNLFFRAIATSLLSCNNKNTFPLLMGNYLLHELSHLGLGSKERILSDWIEKLTQKQDEKIVFTPIIKQLIQNTPSITKEQLREIPGFLNPKIVTESDHDIWASWIQEKKGDPTKQNKFDEPKAISNGPQEPRQSKGPANDFETGSHLGEDKGMGRSSNFGKDQLLASGANFTAEAGQQDLNTEKLDDQSNGEIQKEPDFQNEYDFIEVNRDRLGGDQQETNNAPEAPAQPKENNATYVPEQENENPAIPVLKNNDEAHDAQKLIERSSLVECEGDQNKVDQAAGLSPEFLWKEKVTESLPEAQYEDQPGDVFTKDKNSDQDQQELLSEHEGNQNKVDRAAGLSPEFPLSDEVAESLPKMQYENLLGDVFTKDESPNQGQQELLSEHQEHPNDRNDDWNPSDEDRLELNRENENYPGIRNKAENTSDSASTEIEKILTEKVPNLQNDNLFNHANKKSDHPAIKTENGDFRDPTDESTVVPDNIPDYAKVKKDTIVGKRDQNNPDPANKEINDWALIRTKQDEKLPENHRPAKGVGEKPESGPDNFSDSGSGGGSRVVTLHS